MIRKVLLLGSGALKIGEAGEFDYSGSQAIKALKEEGIKVILANPNIATIQTSKNLADEVYFIPITPYFIEKVIAKEKPEAILLIFGGQTALNCGITLYQKGIFQKYKVKVLGTSVKTIIDTEDRDLFVQRLKKIDLKTPKSFAVTSLKEGINASEKIGFPLILRSGFALGGAGSSLVKNKKQLNTSLAKALSVSKQVLIEEYLGGWKEFEYEVVRDAFDNCITVCNMENVDPMGVHTGESIVVAPSQTLSNYEYFQLRKLAIKCIKNLGIIGECNIQFAVHPQKFDYRIIEVNARLSRSSALASKATGYPLAFVACKLALGYSLAEIKNSVTATTSAFFEPALDYIVVKIPRWDLTKFPLVHEEIGTEMKSVGEVMAIGKTFEEAIQKAVRSLDLGYQGIIPEENEIKQYSKQKIKNLLKTPKVNRINLISLGLLKGLSIKEINQLTGIDCWFLARLQKIVDCYKILKTKKLTLSLLKTAKKLGFSDQQIASLTQTSWKKIREKRLKNGIIPTVKQIDTLAGEFPAKTNYLYLTYHGDKNDLVKEQGKNICVLGSGPYRIGSSVEFDWCAVTAINKLKSLGFKTTVINCNPETVSTDYDISNRLYFEELTLERILDIYNFEKFKAVIISVGGQTPNNLAISLKKEKIPILGTNPKYIDQAEDRNKFSALLDRLKIPQPFWQSVTSVEKVLDLAKRKGFPLLLRPSYVLSGSFMRIIFNQDDLLKTLKEIPVNPITPLVVSQFIQDAQELEVDAVAINGKLKAYAILKHIEPAGVHSGDATIVLHKDVIDKKIAKRIEEITDLIAQNLHINGPFNIQFLVKKDIVLVIECNLRASRSFPFTSKVNGINLIELAILGMLKKRVPFLGRIVPSAVAVKTAQFSFSRLRGADPILQVEMASTGEVACFGQDIYEAYLKAILSTGVNLPQKRILLTIGDYYKPAFLPYAQKIAALGLKIYATEGTVKYFNNFGISSTVVKKGYQKGKRNTLYLIKNRLVDFVINLRDKEGNNHKTNKFAKERSDGYKIRRAAADHHISLITNFETAKLFITALSLKKPENLHIYPWQAYLQNKTLIQD